MPINHLKIEGQGWGAFHKSFNLSRLQVIQYLNVVAEDKKF